jgi:hypothetical protein
MIEENLLQYGMAGIFISYLIFDRQVLLRKITSALERNTDMISKLCDRIK